MTGRKGNSESCFPETLNVENIEVEMKQNSLFPLRPVIKCFVIPPDSKIAVVTKLSRTSNFIGSCWHEALLF